jgi:hypothetical protein
MTFRALCPWTFGQVPTDRWDLTENSPSELGRTISFGPLEFPVVLLPDQGVGGSARRSGGSPPRQEGERRGRRPCGAWLIQLEERVMFVALAVILLLAWALGFAVFHVSGGLIHLLIIVALISVIVHFARGRSAA